jgi:hypothetical protein
METLDKKIKHSSWSYMVKNKAQQSAAHNMFKNKHVSGIITMNDNYFLKQLHIDLRHFVVVSFQQYVYH